MYQACSVAQTLAEIYRASLQSDLQSALCRAYPAHVFHMKHANGCVLVGMPSKGQKAWRER